jgi:hypothetical protein
VHLLVGYDPQPPSDSDSLEITDPQTGQRATEALTGGVTQLTWPPTRERRP